MGAALGLLAMLHAIGLGQPAMAQSRDGGAPSYDGRRDVSGGSGRRGDQGGRRVAGEADFMLLAAQNELNRNRPDAARGLLQDLVARFPGDPAAEEASQLLVEIDATLKRSSRALTQPVGQERGASRRAIEVSGRRHLLLDQEFRIMAGDRIFFAEMSADLGAKSRIVLAAQAEWLKRNPGVMVLIEGHADERGSREALRELSGRRAEAVRARLIEEGVEAERIVVEAYGRERPVAPCNEPACAVQNRRVVTVVVDRGGRGAAQRTDAPAVAGERRR